MELHSEEAEDNGEAAATSATSKRILIALRESLVGLDNLIDKCGDNGGCSSEVLKLSEELRD